MKSFGLLFLSILTLSGGLAMAEPAGQKQPEPNGQFESQPSAKQAGLTPAQVVAQDFQVLSQDHATTGVANSKRER